MSSSNHLIKAVQRATRILAGSGNYDDLVRAVLKICVEAVGAAGGTIYLHDPAGKRLKFQHVLPAEVKELLPSLDISDDYGVAGAAFQNKKTVVKNFPERPKEEWTDFEKATGMPVHSIVATPLALESYDPFGVVQLINKVGGVFADEDIAVLDTVAAVAAMAYVNFRLTETSTRASSLLGMGKVSHDIGNLAASLLATISVADYMLTPYEGDIGAAEIDLDGVRGAIEDLRRSTDRIIGYSRLISDMSAGRELRPNLKPGKYSEAIETAASYLETDARQSHVLLSYKIEETPEEALLDELFLIRIVQNLVGNAIKAVKETLSDDAIAKADKHAAKPLGEVTVHYCFKGDEHCLAVEDSGPGMKPETIEKILNGNARSQWDRGTGSGWGLKIVLELAKALDAKVEIESIVNRGSTFIVKFPHSFQEQMAHR